MTQPAVYRPLIASPGTVGRSRSVSGPASTPSSSSTWSRWREHPPGGRSVAPFEVDRHQQPVAGLAPPIGGDHPLRHRGRVGELVVGGEQLTGAQRAPHEQRAEPEAVEVEPLLRTEVAEQLAAPVPDRADECVERERRRARAFERLGLGRRRLELPRVDAQRGIGAQGQPIGFGVRRRTAGRSGRVAARGA